MTAASGGASPNGPVVIMDGQGRVLRIIPADEALAASREREAAQKHRRGKNLRIRADVDEAVARAKGAAADRANQRATRHAQPPA